MLSLKLKEVVQSGRALQVVRKPRKPSRLAGLEYCLVLTYEALTGTPGLVVSFKIALDVLSNVKLFLSSESRNRQTPRLTRQRPARPCRWYVCRHPSLARAHPASSREPARYSLARPENVRAEANPRCQVR